MKTRTIISILLIFLLVIFSNTSVFASDLTTMKGGADSFITKGEAASSTTLTESSMKDLANTINGVLLAIAVVVAVVVGAVIGIKFITEGAEGRADVKKALVPYIAGCVVVFGSFTIWKVVVTILQSM